MEPNAPVVQPNRAALIVGTWSAGQIKPGAFMRLAAFEHTRRLNEVRNYFTAQRNCKPGFLLQQARIRCAASCLTVDQKSLIFEHLPLIGERALIRHFRHQADFQGMKLWATLWT